MSRRGLHCMVALGLLWGASGCADGGPERPRWAVETVPAHELVRIDHAHAFTRVRDMLVDDAGIWILDGSPPHVTYLRLDDPTEASRFGARGEGPTELRRPVAITRAEDGVEVWDIGNNKRVTFDRSGAVVSARPLLGDDTPDRIRGDFSEITYLDPWRVRRFAHGVAYARFPDGLNHLADATRGALVVTRDGTGLSGEPLVTYADHVPRDSRNAGPFAAMPLWDACTEWVVLWDPGPGEVLWLGANGEVMHRVRPDVSAPSLELAHIEQYLRYMARRELGPGFEASEIDFTQMARRAKPQFGEYATTFTDVRCAPAGEVWLRLFDVGQDPLGRGRTWLRVEPGKGQEADQFPEGYTPYVFSNGGDVYGVEETLHGQTLTVWRRMSRSTQ